MDVSEERHVAMHDARTLSPAASLASHGFACHTWPTAVEDFDDEAQLQSLYYPEIVLPNRHRSQNIEAITALLLNCALNCSRLSGAP